MSATPIADMVAAMLSGGIPPEFIVLAVKTAELSSERNSTGIPVDVAAERRRAYDRERKRNSTGIPPELPPAPPENSTGIPPESSQPVEIIEQFFETPTKSILSSSDSPSFLLTESQRVEEEVVEGQPTTRVLKYPPAFDGWWLAYPRTPTMSKKEALAAWRKLSEDDRVAAVKALPAFREIVARQKPDQTTLHACRFLSQRRFDGFTEKVVIANGHPVGFYAKFGSPELDAWDENRRDFGDGKSYPRDKAGGWHFPTRWPDGYEPRKTPVEFRDDETPTIG